MKADIQYDGLLSHCDLCCRDKQCVTIYRNAKRGERENLCINICKACAEDVLYKFGLPMGKATT